MTLVKMLQTRKASEDGFIVKQFYAGQTYDIAESLARLFFAHGYAERGDLRSFNNASKIKHKIK
jgi:hypothetical protein